MRDQEGQHLSAGSAAGTKLVRCSWVWCDNTAAGISRHAFPASSSAWPHTSWVTRAASKRPSATATNHKGGGWLDFALLSCNDCTTHQEGPGTF